MTILVTGGAGFIGSAVAKKLVERGDRVLILDNFNDYYDPQLKRDRVNVFLKGVDVALFEGDIRDVALVEKIFSREKVEKVVHLAAMAGVRNSLEHPLQYVDINIIGTTVLLEASRKHAIENFIYASSSSVYGKNEKLPFSEADSVDHPISPYAASKKADELLAHVWSHVYGLPTTGLRFFTVYGPWGRPDMALFLFTKHIFEEKPIEVNNFGKMSRNFTYVDDIVSGVLTALDANLPYDIVNIGGDRENTLLEFIEEIEKNVGKVAHKKLMPLPAGDVVSTVADISKLRALGWAPTTRIDAGIKNFVEWYHHYYHV
ncbi:MAG: SDR family NAD(P)-dependent oxidoreductase [Candidatus Moraniibacteriota bacterium]|nr:MAG: SDR family NAD(P)-dependent oxidoreductase [Candidatus Moranbacteria bacterium]